MPGYSKARYSSLIAFLAFYALGLALLLPALSLWLDEILDLIGSQRPSFLAMFEYVRGNAGGVPLSYLLHRFSMQAFGVSAFAGRLPSALASLAGGVGIYVLARQAGIKRPLLAVVFFAICPLQLRYALEARGYSLALCLSIWATVAFLARRFVPYALCMIAALYTLPLTIFVAAAHWLSAIARRERWMWLPLSAAIAASLICFLPWYFYASGWSHSVQEVQGRYHPDLRSLSLILRELVGMGYIGTGLVLVAAACAFVKGGERRFWALYLVIPIAGALAADVVFGYFLSIRQMIVVLAPLSILFAMGVERTSKAGGVLAAVILGAALYADVNYFHRPREDWKSASETLVNEVNGGACVVFAPAESETLYTFFRPELATAKCTALAVAQRVVVAISPYGGTGPVSPGPGFARTKTIDRPEPRIEIYTR